MFDITFADVIRGTIMYLLIRGVIWLIMKFIYNTERSIAILSHYTQRAEGKGHDTKSVLYCQDGHCLIFQNNV